MASCVAIFAGSLLELSADARIARVDAEGATSLRIHEPNDTELRELLLTGILDADGNEVMALREQLQGPLDVLAQKIRHQKNDRLVRQHLDQVVGRAGDVGA